MGIFTPNLGAILLDKLQAVLRLKYPYSVVRFGTVMTIEL